MLRSLKKIEGYHIAATDGELGKVKDFYFDDAWWVVRYFVVDTGDWLPGRRVLISPLSIGEPDWEGKVLPASLTREQVENSPGIERDKPVSRQHEEQLSSYYGWDPYWGVGAYAGAGVPPVPYSPPEPRLPRLRGDPHLRSVREVSAYHIEAEDGEIGHVDDFIAQTGDWAIRYLVADTRNWLPGRKVLLSPTWAKEVVWSDGRVRVDLTREQVKNSPPFDPAQPVNRELETRLYDYYGRPAYWT
jgi:hypothetical protein